jgi:hypothetical protein
MFLMGKNFFALIRLLIFALNLSMVSPLFASETLLAGYETSETNLTLSSPDTGITLTKVLASTGGAPRMV